MGEIRRDWTKGDARPKNPCKTWKEKQANKSGLSEFGLDCATTYYLSACVPFMTSLIMSNVFIPRGNQPFTVTH